MCNMSGPFYLFMQLSKLVGVVCSTPTDQHEYFSVVAVTISALKSLPALAIATQHTQTLRLLEHLHQQVCVLSGGVNKERRNAYQDLSGAFLPLLEKHPDRSVALRILLLWAMEGICDSLFMPHELCASE